MQDPPSIRVCGQGDSERGADLVDHAGRQHQGALFVVQAVDLIQHVFADPRVAAVEGHGSRDRIGRPGQTQRSQAETGGPAIGDVGQVVHGGVGQLERPRCEQVTGLLPVEGEVGRAHVTQCAGDPQPVQRQGWIVPGNQDQVQSGWWVTHHLFQQAQRIAPLNQVDVVQHQHDVEPSKRGQERHRRIRVTDGLRF